MPPPTTQNGILIATTGMYICL